MRMKSLYGVVSIFKKGQKEPVAEWSLRPIEISIAQKIFHTPVDDLLGDLRSLNQTEALQLQPYAPRPIEVQKYDYVLECYETEPFWMHDALAVLM